MRDRAIPEATVGRLPVYLRALVDMAETTLLAGEGLPKPDPTVTDPGADLEEPIHLLLSVSSS